MRPPCGCLVSSQSYVEGTAGRAGGGHSQQYDADCGNQKVEPGSASGAGVLCESCVGGVNDRHSLTAGGVSLKKNRETLPFRRSIRCSVKAA